MTVSVSLDMTNTVQSEIGMTVIARITRKTNTAVSFVMVVTSHICTAVAKRIVFGNISSSVSGLNNSSAFRAFVCHKSRKLYPLPMRHRDNFLPQFISKLLQLAESNISLPPDLIVSSTRDGINDRRMLDRFPYIRWYCKKRKAVIKHLFVDQILHLSSFWRHMDGIGF